MMGIFKNKDERARFVSNKTVLKFFEEQQALDNYLYSTSVSVRPKFFSKEIFKATKRISKPKVIAYLYQQSETKVMDIVREILKKNGRAVIANIHDAVVTRKKLSFDFKHEIELEMQDQTGNKYWRIAGSKLEQYKPSKQYKFDSALLSH